MNSGFVKIHRKIKDWEWYTDIPVCHLYQHLIREANHKETKFRGRAIAMGQVVTGLHALSGQTGLSPRQVRTALAKLESTGEITRFATNQFTIVTINNYKQYQVREEIERQTDDKRKTNERQRLKNDKNVKKGKDIYRPEFISAENWNDLILHRKKHPKKPVNSERALKILSNKIKACMTAGYSEELIIDTIIGRNWQTIELDWLNNQGGNNNGKGQPQRTYKQELATAYLKEKLEESGNSGSNGKGSKGVGAAVQPAEDTGGNGNLDVHVSGGRQLRRIIR